MDWQYSDEGIPTVSNLIANRCPMSCQVHVTFRSRTGTFPVMSEVQRLTEVPVMTDISNRRSECLRFRNV